MSTVQPICILWDASHIWGLMAWRAVCALGLPCRLMKAKEIAEGALLGKQDGQVHQTPLLLVPGGSARLKAAALGAQGRDAIRRWLANGGKYLGFCGGAGLALTHTDAEQSLNICPWTRAAYSQRLHHLISGHVLANILQPRQADFADLLPPQAPESFWELPVWWPGRFAPTPDSNVEILATYSRPGADFWLADLPLKRIPPYILDRWQTMYGLHLSADFLDCRPLVISGSYGHGRYILSYSHLETPYSPNANAWFAHLLRCAGLEPQRQLVPLWQLRTPHAVWPSDGRGQPLLDALKRVRDLLNLAVEHHLFFARTHWLWGWRTGLPGAVCNNLHAALCTAVSLAPSPAALAYWDDIRSSFDRQIHLFATKAEEYLLACRLAATLSPLVPDVVGQQELNRQQQEIFGHPMSGGGLVQQLLESAEELVYLSQNALSCEPLP